MLFSVVTPTYNVGAKLPSTVASVRAQQFADCEHLVVDGGSTDGTVDWLRTQENGAALRWISERDQGVYDAMNKGIRMARGEYLYFIGAGDRMRPGVLPKLASVLAQGPAERRPELVYGKIFWEAGRQVHGRRYNRYYLVKKNLCHQGIFYHRSLFTRFGEYDLRYPVLADYAMNIILFGRRDVRRRFVNLMIADFEGGGLSAQQVDHGFYGEYAALVRKHLGLLPWVFARRRVFYRPRFFLAAVRERLVRAGMRP